MSSKLSKETIQYLKDNIVYLESRKGFYTKNEIRLTDIGLSVSKIQKRFDQIISDLNKIINQ